MHTDHGIPCYRAFIQDDITLDYSSVLIFDLVLILVKHVYRMVANHNSELILDSYFISNP